MDIKQAAKTMRPFFDKCKSHHVDGDNATSIEHLAAMLTSIKTGSVTGEKAHRWLGWVQGMVCCRGGATLDEMKAVNLAA